MEVESVAVARRGIVGSREAITTWETRPKGENLHFGPQHRESFDQLFFAHSGNHDVGNQEV